MALSFSQLLTYIGDKLGKPLIGQKITGADVKDVANATANFITIDGDSLPPYSKPNATVGAIPRLSSTYQYGNSVMSHFDGLGGGVKLDGAWQVGNNALRKVDLFQPTAHATNRYITNITIPKGALGLVTLEVRVSAVGQSAGVIHKVFAFDANSSSGATNSTVIAHGDITTKLFLGNPDWSGSDIVIPLYEKTAVNVAKLYVVEVAVASNTSYITSLLTKSTLLSSAATTALSAGNVNSSVQMSIVNDAAGLKLDGDVTTPAVNQMYGTNAAGTRGWYNVPQDYDLVDKTITLLQVVNTTTKTQFANLNGPGALGTTQISELRVVGTIINNNGATNNITLEIELVTNAGTSNIAFPTEGFVTGNEYVFELKVWAYREGTAITVLGSWQASRNAGGVFETGGVRGSIAAASSITNMRANVTLGAAAATVSLERRMAWVRVI
jgi:hypothetical protein